MIKKILGIAPQQERDGSYKPSRFSLSIATKSKTDYQAIDYGKITSKKNKILVLFSEQQHLEMKNGKKFSTGNHPVEALVPMLYLQDAGFEFDVFTINGHSVVFEMWAFPDEDENVKEIYEVFMNDFIHPKSLADFAQNDMPNAEEYAAIFIPGGHGAMIDLPNNESVSKLLHWAKENELYIISICHGPAAFLSSSTENKEDFLFQGYEMAAFPDIADKLSPLVGYLPGQMKSHLTEPLQQRGAIIVNKNPDKTVCLDRKLITGASPLAANDLGKLAVIVMIDDAKTKEKKD